MATDSPIETGLGFKNSELLSDSSLISQHDIVHVFMENFVSTHGYSYPYSGSSDAEQESTTEQEPFTGFSPPLVPLHFVSRERGNDYLAERSGQTKKLDDCRRVEQGAYAPNGDQQYGC